MSDAVEDARDREEYFCDLDLAVGRIAGLTEELTELRALADKLAEKCLKYFPNKTDGNMDRSPRCSIHTLARKIKERG